MTMRCKKCGGKVPDGALSCPNCGDPISEQDRAEAKRMPYDMTAFGCITMVLVVFAIQAVVLVIKVMVRLFK